MSINNQVNVIVNSLLDIIYPNNCTICSTHLYLNELYLCLSCKYDLPYINQSKTNTEKLQKLFWGRVEIQDIFALLNYQKGNQTQKILHALKYHKKKKIASYFGEIIGELITDNNLYDYIIPVPLHPKKKNKRGFNQSTIIANGVCKTTSIPLLENVIERNTYNKSQTKFTKYDRWDNVKRIFNITQPKKLENKHIILLDDVLTTGATIEACVKEFLKVKGCKVSIAVLAARI